MPIDTSIYGLFQPPDIAGGIRQGLVGADMIQKLRAQPALLQSQQTARDLSNEAQQQTNDYTARTQRLNVINKSLLGAKQYMDSGDLEGAHRFIQDQVDQGLLPSDDAQHFFQNAPELSSGKAYVDAMMQDASNAAKNLDRTFGVTEIVNPENPNELIKVIPKFQGGQASFDVVGKSPAQAKADIEVKAAGEKETEKLRAQGKLLPKVRSAVKKAETIAASKGAEFTSLERAKASLPGLQEVTEKLRKLSDVATYTAGGKLFDSAAKELGFGSTKGATARAKMVSIVDNQVLPLLRDTFGAAFTEREGDKLRDTILDPDATPEAKKATLDAFIEQKMRDIETQERQLGIKPAQQEPQTTQQTVQPGAARSYMRFAQ